MYKLLLALTFVAPAALFGQGKTSGVALQIQPRVGAGHVCLDARGGHDRDGDAIAVYSCHPGLDQQLWTVTASPDNKHAIIGVGGYCLDVRGVNSSNNGSPAQLWTCHFGQNQEFSLAPDGRIHEVRTNKCLIAPTAKDGTAIVLDTCKNTPGEIWSLVQAK